MQSEPPSDANSFGVMIAIIIPYEISDILREASFKDENENGWIDVP
jgi:hypothetical protein